MQQGIYIRGFVYGTTVSPLTVRYRIAIRSLLYEVCMSRAIRKDYSKSNLRISE